MLIIITGKTGVGKTTILKNIKFKNIIFLDEIIKNVFYKKDHIVYNKVIKTFKGVEKNNSIDIKILGKIVFHNVEALNKLNQIIIPELKKYFKILREKDDFIIEMATFINHYQEFKDFVDKVIIIKSKKKQLQNKFNYLKNKPNLILDTTIPYDDCIINKWNIKKSVKKLDKILNEYNVENN